MDASLSFLPTWLYTAAEIPARERQRYAERLWHPVGCSTELPEEHAQATQLLELPLLLTREQGTVRALLNRCPHRGMPFQDPRQGAQPCRRLVCPYHGWTYDLDGQLRAAAREADFLQPFNRADWPLSALPCRELGGLIWVAAGP